MFKPQQINVSFGRFISGGVVAAVLCWQISAVSVLAQDNSTKESDSTQWIWNTREAATAASDQPVYFRLRFESTGQPSDAELLINADNHYQFWINGKMGGRGDNWQSRDRYKVRDLIREGENVLAVLAENDGQSPAGLAVTLSLKTNAGSKVYASGQPGWKTNANQQPKWTRLSFDDSKWQPAYSLGLLSEAAPWGGRVQINEIAVQQSRFPERPAQDQFHLLPTDHLTLLGGTFVERLQKDAGLEAQLYANLANRQSDFQVRNLGWSGDDVHGTARAVFGSRREGMQRLMQDAIQTQATVVGLCYGANESFAGEAGIESFREGLQSLVDQLRNDGATVVLITPPPFENLGGSLPDMNQANVNLQQYCRVIKDIAESSELPVIDLNGKFASRWEIESAQKTKTDGKESRFTTNGVHLNESGYRLANAILFDALVDGGEAIVPTSNVKELIRQKNQLYFHRYRPQNETYLFLFRKHEQGNNAVEIPQFDELVKDVEKRIRGNFEQN